MALLESYVAGPPPLRELENGAVRVGDTRVSLESVIYLYKQGRTAEEIVDSYSTLELADVYAVIAYYLRHQDAVEAYLARQEEAAAEMRQKWEELYPQSDNLRAKLIARKAEIALKAEPEKQAGEPWE